MCQKSSNTSDTYKTSDQADQAEQTESQADYSPSTQTIRQSTTIPVAVARYVECPVTNNQLTKIITQCNLGDPPGYI
jgi:hypothetical protein